MAATLESALVIVDRASGPVRGIRREVRGLHSDAERAGRALDDMAGPKAGRDLQKIAEDTRVFRGALRGVRDELPMINRGMDTYARRVDATRRMTDKLIVSTDRLAASLRTVGAIDARPRVQIDGLAQSRAELAMLRAELRAFGASTATARARVAGGGLPGGGARTAAYLGSGGAGIVTTRTAALAGAAVVALPAVQALGGAVGALGGSLMGAGLGGGAVGIAGGGALAAGLGSVVAIAKPAQKELGNALKAQTKYTDAIKDFGSASTQAVNAKREMDQAFGNDAALRRATTQISAFRKEWQQLSGPAREQWFGLIADATKVGRRAAPRMAQNATVATRGVRSAGVSQARFLAGQETQDTLAILTREFARDLPIAEHALENVELVFERIARASRPFFHEGVVWIDETTKGWERSTRDAGKLRREVGGFVEDLKDWGRLTHSAFELAKDVLMGGRPAGGSAVEDLTKTLDRWDVWVQRNPEKMDAFFRNAVSDTEAIAGSVVDIVHGLHDMADELRPLLGPLNALAHLFGALSSNLSPGAAATLLLGVRAGKNRLSGGGSAAAGAAGAGGPGGLPLILGGGGARVAAGAGAGERLAARAVSTGPVVYGNGYRSGDVLHPAYAGAVATETAAGGRLAGAGSRVLRGAGAAGRFALPAVAIGGLTGAFGARGSNAGGGLLGTAAHGIINTAQGAGAIFGLTHPVLGTDERVNRGLSRAQQFVGQLPGGDAPTSVQAARAARGLLPELASAEQHAADAIGSRNNFAEAMAYLKALRSQAQAYKDIAKEAAHTATVERNQRSRDHAAELTTSFGKAHDTYAQRMGPEEAMDKTLRGVYSKMRSMNRVGAKILGENVLGWAAAQAKANPALAGEVDWLTRHIENRFSKMGDQVLVINGQILTGSAAQWKSIGASITDPANKALSETSAAFAKLRDQALGELKMMGFSDADAAAVFKGVRSGSIKASAVNVRTGSGQSQMASNANLARSHGIKTPIGDGIGDGPGTVATMRRSAAASGGGLMGANPALGGYAAEGARFGLHVSSGARPGAITASGNVSLHASGDAIDEAGPASAMLRYAKYMVSKHGSGLDELIHTPLGFGIKNGKRVPLSFWGATINAQHQDHVHVGDRTPDGGGGGLSAMMSMDTAGPGMHHVNLRASTSGLGGVPGALSNAAMSGVASALSQKINALGGGAMGAVSGADAGAGGTASALRARFGLPAIFDAIRSAESGNDPNAHNPSGASGYYQIMMPLHAGLVAQVARRLGRPANVDDPIVNTAVAAELYKQSGTSPWVSSQGVWGGKGDGLGWSRPSLGGGQAQITVNGGGGHTIRVSSAPISIRGTGVSAATVQAMHRRHQDAFVAEVLEALESDALEGAGSLL